MSASSAQLQFAAEFVLFLAAASGLAVMALRGGLLSEKLGGELILTCGFFSLGTSAFLHGSQLIDEADSPVILGLRGAGLAFVLIGCLWGWAAREISRVLLGVAVVFIAAGSFIDPEASTTFARVALVTGALCLGTSVLLASRRAIAARVAATAATTLLIVVLVLGVAISAVLVNTVQDSAVDRIQRRAENEAQAAATEQPELRIRDARIVADAIVGDLFINNVLAAKLAPSGSDILNPALNRLSTRFLDDVALAFVARGQLPHGAARLENIQLVQLAGTEVVRQALETEAERGSIELLGSPPRPFAVGVEPVIAPRTEGFAGVVIALRQLDESYLTLAASDDRDLSLGLVKNTVVVSKVGDQPPLKSIAGMVSTALVDGRSSRDVVGNRFVAVAPVKLGDGTPQLALVASSPTTLVNRTRDELFRNLFLVALGGAMLALLFAVVVGARIGAGLTRLRAAAEAIQSGDLGVRAGIDSPDEVGVLSRAFDSMASSVQEKTVTEARLRGRLEAVVAGMGEALVALDGDGRVTDFNRAAEELLGVHSADAMGRPVGDVVRLSTEDGTPIPLESSTGASRWSTIGFVDSLYAGRVPVAVSAGALRGPGTEGGGSVLVLADLTREREVEQMKKEFLSRVGHELRHPLVPLMGYAEILSRRDVPAEQAREMHKEMLEQSRKLLRIIEMLEFFAAAGAGRILLRQEEVDPRTVIDDVVHRWQQRLGSADIIRPRVRRSTPKVLADRRRLTSCLDELVDNAVKFSVNGGKITVSAESAPGGVEISVTDHGKGMTAAEQEMVFDEFVQADPSDTRPYGGLGLGLAFVRRVVEAHGGSLDVESVVGKGSKFSILVPDVPKETAR